MKKEIETKKLYDAISKKSFEDWFDNDALLPTLSNFIGKLPGNPAVLDLGCGVGGESKRLVQLGASVTGIDFSEKSVQLARENVPDAEFLLKDIMEMDFPGDSFHGVLEAGVLFHFDENEQNLILDNIISILKPAGRFLSYYPEGESGGMEEINLEGETYFRYSRSLPSLQWVEQVMAGGFKEYTEYEFSMGPFKCVEFSL